MDFYNNLFENEVKNKLQWTLKRWRKEGVSALGFKRLINSLKYWGVQLASAFRTNNVIFTLYSEGGRAYPSLQKFADCLSELNKDIVIQGYAKFKNRRYLSVSFCDIETKDYVVQNLTNIDNCKVAYLHWVKEALLDSVVIDWLSNHTNIDLPIEYVSQFFDIKSVIREETKLENGTICTSGKIIFKGTFKENINIHDIPHFAVIDGLECLILIEGRPLMCIVCKKLGHKASCCTKAFCKMCKSLVSKSHLCVALDIEETQLKDIDENGEIDYVRQNDVAVTCSKANIQSEKLENDPSRNLFQNLKIDFTNKVVLENNCQQDLQLAQSNLSSLCHDSQVKEVNDSSEKEAYSHWFSNFNKRQILKENILNEHITEDVHKSNPNFTLMDTSSSESDDDSEGNNMIVDQAQWCISDLNRCAEVSRSFMQSASSILKKNQKPTNKKQENLESLLTLGSLGDSKFLEGQLNNSHFIDNAPDGSNITKTKALVKTKKKKKNRR